MKPGDKATYKGRTYVVRWAGETKFGHRVKLEFEDGSKVFWADSNLVDAAPSLDDTQPLSNEDDESW